MVRTAGEIESDIAIFREAIRNIALTGQSYSIGSGSSTRVFTMADIDKLRGYLADLQRELDGVNGSDGILLGF